IRASHHMNFWMGAWFDGLSASLGSGPSKSMRFGSQLDACWPKPGVRLIAKPRKSVRAAPSGQSNARSTRVGEQYERALTAIRHLLITREFVACPNGTKTRLQTHRPGPTPPPLDAFFGGSHPRTTW